MKCALIILTAFAFTLANISNAQSIRLEELDLSTVEQGWETPKKGKNVSNKSMVMNGKVYETGIGTHATSVFKINLFKSSLSFSAVCGLDDMVARLGGHAVVFEVIGDRKTLWKSDTIHPGDAPVVCKVKLNGLQVITLKVTGVPGSWHTHVNWADAVIEFKGTTPVSWKPTASKSSVTFPAQSKKPCINTPTRYGAKPGSPFLYKVPVSGVKPIQYSVDQLPEGLVVNNETGIITGTVTRRGVYDVLIRASNEAGTTTKRFKIIIGDEIGLTPPLGWNSWNAWGVSIDREKVKQAAEAFVNSGLIEYGWSYINVDDGWQSEKRDGRGVLQPNEKFGDMKSLVDSIHSLGLKFGLYSSPGPLTCWRFPGSYRFEDIDAQTYGAWGIDYLKYDWCSYKNILPPRFSKAEAIKPYAVMGEELLKQPRDIYYSLCQYGMHDVWSWGKSVHANSWRTTEDIYDSWASVSQIGFSHDRISTYPEPGHINDPDMLVIGVVGWGKPRNTRLSEAEQLSHITLWSMLSAPMLVGCDLSQLDAFTKNLLTNTEVLAIHQDALVKSASRIYKKDGLEIWKKPLEDGGTAIALFNVDETEALTFSIPADLLQVQTGKQIRNVWQQTDIGTTAKPLKGMLDYHSCLLVKIMP